MKKRIAGLGLGLYVLSACSAGSSSGTCASSITFAGEVYVGHAARVPPERLAESLPGAVQQACNDTNDSLEKDQPTTVRRLDGLDPATAVFGGNGDPAVYVRDGTDASRLPGWLGIIGQ